jgi:drug/metabolite transporter (DMT)-like permease
MLSNPPSPWRVGLVLGSGVLAVSSSALWVRLCIDAAGVADTGFSLWMGAMRLAVASLFLIPNWKVLRRSRLSLSAWFYSMGAGLCLALHFATWISSLSYTAIAASTTLVTTNPIWVALFAWWGWGEKPSRRSLLGIALALGGSAIVALGSWGSTAIAPNPLLGNSLALLGAMLISLYFLLGRQVQRQGLSLTHYVTLAYGSAAIALFPLPKLLETPYTGYPIAVYVYIVLMAIVAQLWGHTSLNWSLKWLSPTLVTLAILFEPVGASLLGWWIFGEIPAITVILGGIVVLSGVAIAVMGQSSDW